MVKVVTLIVVDCYKMKKFECTKFVRFSVEGRIHDILKDHHHDVQYTELSTSDVVTVNYIF